MSETTSRTEISTCTTCKHAPAHDHHPDSVHEHGLLEGIALARIIVAILGAAAIWFQLWEPKLWPSLPQFSVIGTVSLAFAGYPIFREAFENLLSRRMTMELSMTIAIVAAAAISEWFTALVVTLFVLIAEELEHLTVAKGRVAILDLVTFIPREARVRRNSEVVSMPVSEIAAGDQVLVSPGEKVPVDGVVVDGHSYVDQSRITGESMPAEKHAGSNVFAGSINQMGALEIRTEKVGRSTTYGQIIEAVEAAEHTRAPVQKLADQLAGYLVYVALAAAALTYLITRDIRDTISVVIVAGACGIAAGTPLAILGGIGRAAKLGSIIKGGIHLETLGRVDTVVLDKTGTLTLGAPAVQAINPAPGFDAETVLRLAAAAEFHSEHPLARAIVAEAEARAITIPKPDSFRYTIARGITALIEHQSVLVGNRKLLAENGISAPDRQDGRIGSDIVIAIEGAYAGEIVVADTLRPEARDVRCLPRAHQASTHGRGIADDPVDHRTSAREPRADHGVPTVPRPCRGEQRARPGLVHEVGQDPVGEGVPPVHRQAKPEQGKTHPEERSEQPAGVQQCHRSTRASSGSRPSRIISQ